MEETLNDIPPYFKVMKLCTDEFRFSAAFILYRILRRIYHFFIRLLCAVCLISYDIGT